MDERRKHPRFPCRGTVRVRALDTNVQFDGNIADVSYEGCYVEMLTPFPVGTPVEAHLDVKSIEFAATGEVRIQHPGMGMGVHFKEVAPAEQAKLDQLLAKLAAGD